MFLTKKSGHPLHKPKAPEHNKPKKALAGWQDDEEDKPQPASLKPVSPSINLLQTATTVTLSPPVMPPSNGSPASSKNQPYYTWEQLNDRSDIDCEKRLIEDIVQPGGIRIKPNENTLIELLKQVRAMDTAHIGSLLLSKLEVNYPFAVKAKALYAIEFLAKKDKEYLTYFQQHAGRLAGFPEPEDNAENYRKILKSVMGTVSSVAASSLAEKHQEKHVFEDPGYYQEAPKSELGIFIQESASKAKKPEGKKLIIGPGQVKNKKQMQIGTSSLLMEDMEARNQLGNSQRDRKGLKPTIQAQNLGKQTDLISLGQGEWLY